MSRKPQSIFLYKKNNTPQTTDDKTPKDQNIKETGGRTP